MTTFFLGGSRRISQLPGQAVELIRQIVEGGHDVIVGDASGADRAIQKLLSDAGCRNVTVFCSGEVARNNVGAWPVSRVKADGAAKGFQFFAVKDRAMARRADIGVMVWDGNSVGTLLNVLRLVRSGKKARILSGTTTRTLHSSNDWHDLLRTLDHALIDELRAKATGDEWIDAASASRAKETPITDDLFTVPQTKLAGAEAQHVVALNVALADRDVQAINRALRSLAAVRGIHAVARRSGMPQTKLEKAFAGKPSLGTVLKILHALDIRFVTAPAIDQPAPSTQAKKPSSRKPGSARRARIAEERQPELVTLARGPLG